MSTTCGELMDIFIEEGTTVGKVFASGTILHIPLFLLTEARIGDKVLIESGVAISRVRQQSFQES